MSDKHTYTLALLDDQGSIINKFDMNVPESGALMGSEYQALRAGRALWADALRRAGRLDEWLKEREAYYETTRAGGDR